jgi:hypothetical protein
MPQALDKGCSKEDPMSAIADIACRPADATPPSCGAQDSPIRLRMDLSA